MSIISRLMTCHFLRPYVKCKYEIISLEFRYLVILPIRHSGIQKITVQILNYFYYYVYTSHRVQ